MGSYLLGVATKGISKTNDENKKFAFFALLKCVSGILRNIEFLKLKYFLEMKLVSKNFKQSLLNS